VDGASVGAVTSYTFTNVTAGHTNRGVVRRERAEHHHGLGGCERLGDPEWRERRQLR
jgi:hypothetical protein